MPAPAPLKDPPGPPYVVDPPGAPAGRETALAAITRVTVRCRSSSEEGEGVSTVYTSFTHALASTLAQFGLGLTFNSNCAIFRPHSCKDWFLPGFNSVVIILHPLPTGSPKAQRALDAYEVRRIKQLVDASEQG